MSVKAAIWVRVSTDRRHEDNQIPDLERLCEHRGWEITRRYEIADASAYKGEHRHALQRMLDDAHRGEFSVLVIWAVDRLCRQGIEELLRLIRELRERKVCSSAIKSPGSTAPTRPPSCWPPSPHASPRRSPCAAPSGFAPAWRAAKLKESRWAAPPPSEAKTLPASHRGLQTGMGATQGQPDTRRNLRVKRGRHRPGGCRPISVLVDATAERGHATRLAALFVPLFVTARIDPGQCCPPGRA